MIVIEQNGNVQYFMIALRRGELVLEKLRGFLKDRNIDAGLIISGIGSMDICNIHFIKSTTLPPEDEFIKLEGPIEIASLQGSIAGGEPHIHVSVFNQVSGKTFIGHLEDGSRCCYRIELGLIVFPSVKTARITDPNTGLIDIIEKVK